MWIFEVKEDFMNKAIKSPLRYPGGKSRAISQIEKLIPKKMEEYREPFVGGGSLFIYLKQKYPELKMWINDSNPELYCFWKSAQVNSDKLIKEIQNIKNNEKNGKSLFNELVSLNTSFLSEIERATRFFVLNRITFSGLAESGGYSEMAFNGRFTQSSIERVSKIEELLQDIKITNLDYEEVLTETISKTFIFLDPPYLSVTKSKLYGKNGILHTEFNHDDFAISLKKCNHSWLITYDDSPEIRNNFKFAKIRKWQLQYGMNNSSGKADKGKEIFISNY